MPVRPDLQLEKCIDDAFRKNDFKPLKTLLQIEICEDVKIKCSKQFFHKLDDLICRELNKKDIQTVSLILVSFGRCGRNISILGQAGLLTLIKQGLVQKEIILSRGNSKDEAVINMIEDLFDLLMVIYDISDEGKRQVVEGFIPRICALVIDSRVNFYIQQETLKRMNAMLDKIPQDAKEMLINQEMLILMNSMGRRILDAGDYDLQVGIIEALYRMTTEKQRRRLVPQWFSMDFIANAFKGIKDSEFETDCRMFLNLVNGMLGDKRRVFTFPCLSAFLDKYELQIPSDEKLEEFWIDFNLGSQTLSFYVAGDHDDHQWEAVTVSEEEVQIYSIEERESKKLLTIITKNIFKINKRQGEKLLLHFDASLEITNVLHKIYGTNKHKEFTRKQGISVAKTSVHILFDASGSQILVPESQISPVAEELINLKEKPNSQEEFAKPPKYIKNSTQGDRENSQPEIITPSKRKMSEASVIVTSAERYKKRSPLLLIDTSTPRRGKIKPPLQVMSSAEKPDLSKTSESEVDNALSHGSKSPTGRSRGHDTDKHIKTANIVEKTENKDTEFLNKSFNEPQNIVPDSQAVRKNKKPMLPGVSVSMNGNKMPSKLACWTPVTNIKLCNNQRASTTSQGDAVNQDSAINKKITKEKSSSSISDDNSEAGKVAYKKEAVQRNKANKAEGDVYRRSDQQLSQRSGQKNSDDTKQSDWHIESETTFKSVHLNKTAEESPFYGKKNVLSKGVNTAICDKSPPRKSAKSYRKPRKRLTSELNSWDLKQKKLRENSRGKALTDAAESLISQINERYKTKDDMPSMRKLKESLIDSGFSSKSDLHLSKEKVQKKCYRQLKTTFVNTSKCSLDDVYNFNLNGADEPVIKLGIQECQATVREACVDSSIKLNHDELESSLQTKNKRVVTSHKNKKLFSDSDTEYRCDDDKSDISWLREPKSKPHLIEYGRNRRVKGKQKSRKSRPSLEREQPSSKMTPKKNITKKVDETIPDGRTRLPRRATNTKKYYKDLSNSESECEQEVSQSLKETLPVKESHLTSPLSVSSEGEKIGCDVPCDSSHVSGPTHHLSRKRMYIEDSQINSEGLEEEEEGRANLFPQKLSKIEDADHQVHQISESTSPLSTNDSSNPAKKWETEISGASVMCEQFNTEFKRNCNTPQKLMDYFTKQSWKTVQQHLKIMNHHIQEYRIKKLDKFQFSIIDELENFERDSQALKDLEKESVDFWEKTVQKFSAYQKSEQERVHLLKASLDKNVFYNTNQEETLCTSEICFMKENLKVLQDSLLQKMQEEELLSLRRGLLSLFMAPEADVTVDI